MLNVSPLFAVGLLLLAGCVGGSDNTGTTPQRTTPAANQDTTSGTGVGNSPATDSPGTGQNNPNTYGAGNGSTTSHPGTDAARP